MRHHKTHQLLAVLFAAFFLFALASCGRKIKFNSSSVVPAATGSVKVKKDNNKNYSVDVKITNLAPSDKLTPPRKVYVVWMVTQDNETKNIGQIKSGSGLLGSSLKASLSTVTTFSPMRVFITAEDDPAISYPQGQPVLSTGDFH